METARHAVIPEFDFEVKEAVRVIGKESNQPSGAMRITAAGEGGDFQLYVRKELLNGLDPKPGDVFFGRISIDGTFEPRITLRSLRPASAERKGAA